jgi:hypothetical protein
MSKNLHTRVILVFVLNYFGFPLLVYAQPFDPGTDVEQAKQTTSVNPVPLGDENVASMFFGPITPEQADAYANDLQLRRLKDPNAEEEIPAPTLSEPAPKFYLETVDGVRRSYTLDNNGSKIYYPPTSATNFSIAIQQSVGNTFASLKHSFATNVVLALAMIKPEAMEFTDVVLESTVYAVVGTPPQCAPPISENCVSSSYGQGMGSDKADLHVLTNDGYDYAPSVLYDEGKYKMWWCGDANLAGDRILYAESTTPPLQQGSWTVLANGNHGIVFQPPGGSAFDGGLTCDPSVVKVGGTYYMYYSGLPSSYSVWSNTTRIGAAYSYDGKNWQRWTNAVPGSTAGSPIISTHIAGASSPNYGASHPSVVFVDGYFYMTYDDTTGAVGPGQYAIRSTDPFFQTEVQEWNAGSWTTLGGAPTTSHVWLPTYNVDWAYSRATKEFIVAIDGVGVVESGEYDPRGSHSSIRVFNKDLTSETVAVTHVQAEWFDGPALAKYSGGAVLQDTACNNLWLRVIRAGRDWPTTANGVPGASCPGQPSGNDAACEYSFHQVLAHNDPTGCNDSFYKHCLEMSYDGYDLSTGLGSNCRARYTGALVADDYDGDKISDPVVWRPSSGVWWTERSITGQQHGEQWGLSTDQPIFGADFDGDQIADPAVKRPSTGVYYMLPSTGTCPSPFVPYSGTKGCSWSSGWASNDVPLPGDYDGDGKTDIAARSSSGAIHFIPSSGGSCPSYFSSTTYSGIAGCAGTVTSGASGDKALVTDYDGDGKTDIAWHHPASGQIWTYLSSGAACSSYRFAASGSACYTNMFSTADIPVPADFDGDGKTDIMWWNPSSFSFNTWGMSRPTPLCPPNFTNMTTYCTFGMGAAGDVPLGKQFNSDGNAEPTIYRPQDSFVSPIWYSAWYVNKTGGSNPPSNIWGGSAYFPPNVFRSQWGLSTDRVEGLR